MRLIGTMLALTLSPLAMTAGAAQTSVEQQSGEDLYAAGASLQVSRPVAGDAVLAGGSVLITESVAQDVLVAGGSVTVTGAVDDDVRAAGGSVTITDDVGGDVIAAGGSVTLASGSRVEGNAWAAGGVVRLSGTVRADVRAAGGEVVLGGRIDGDAEVYAESLEVLPGTVIAGTLHYRGPAPATIADNAEIGELVYTERTFRHRGMSIVGGIVVSLVATLSLVVSSLLFAWLFPNLSRRAAENARTRPLLSLGVGLLTVIVTPLLATALFALVVTGPVAIVLLACYVAVLTGGAFTALLCLAGWLRNKFLADRGEGAGIRIVSALMAGLVYWLVGWVPFVGVLIVLLAFAAGTGGLILLATRLYKQPATE